MNKQFMEALEDSPVIPVIKDNDGLEAVLKSDCKIVFVLYGDVLNIQDIIGRIKEAGKILFVNVDLLDGFANKEIVVRYLKRIRIPTAY